MPVKGLLHDPMLDKPNEKNPWFMRIGPAFSSTLVSKLHRCNILLKYYRPIYNYLSSYGVPAILPREFNGPGMPCEFGRDRLKDLPKGIRTYILRSMDRPTTNLWHVQT